VRKRVVDFQVKNVECAQTSCSVIFDRPSPKKNTMIPLIINPQYLYYDTARYLADLGTGRIGLARPAHISRKKCQVIPRKIQNITKSHTIFKKSIFCKNVKIVITFKNNACINKI
jgi:hypothetical protein